jgi:hypothetical protein
MGLFFEVIVSAAMAWWLWESSFRSWLERRRTQGVVGTHDDGVWVNEYRWEQIVTGLDDELESGDQGHKPGRRD